MSIRSFLTKICILGIGLMVVMRIFSVKAADPVSSTLTYSPDNSFIVKTSPEMDGSVALYYKKQNGDIDGVFGSEGASLAAQTCSSGTCVNASIDFGIVKIYIPSEKWLKIIYFHKTGNTVKIVKEDVYPDIAPSDIHVVNTIGSPPDNVLLQLSLSESDWLKSPADIQPTNTVTPTLTNTPTLTLIPTAKTTGPAATLTPSPTPANPVTPQSCSSGTGFINETVSINQTLQLNGLPVPAYRSNSSYAYGLPDPLYFSLGLNGSVTYKFAGSVNNVPGIDFNIYEETLGRSTYPEEKAKIEISADGVTYITLPTLASGRSPLGVTGFDIASSGLTSFRYIRITDIKNPLNLNLDYDGFDLNAVVAVSQDCPTPTPSNTPTSSPTKTLTPTKTTPTPTLSPSPTPADHITPPVCKETGGVSETLLVNQTTQRDGLPVPLYRSDTSYGYGSPDPVYYTLGIGGTATFKFPGLVKDIPGIDFNIYEETLGRTTYPEERARVEVSSDAVTWFVLSPLASSRSPLGITGFDFHTTGLTSFQYIRLTDIPNPANFNPESDGFDINAIVANFQDCGTTPAPTQPITMSPTTSPTGTQQTAGLLTIQKFNNRVDQSISPGGDVTYTIIVSAGDAETTGEPSPTPTFGEEKIASPTPAIPVDREPRVMASTATVDNVEVVDLPPNGFNYEHGSWTAISNLRGDIKASGTTTEPTYHSPGTWKLGTMQAGEKVTLTYRTTTNSDVDAGVYTDLAWAKGNENTVVSTGVSSPFVDNEFVGSEVTISKNSQTTASIDVKRNETKTGVVRGASTRLPRTGASTIWVTLATLILVAGTSLVGLGFKMLAVHGSDRPLQKTKRSFRVFRFMVQIMVVVGLLTVLTAQVNAAAVTSIRISLPADRNNSDFKIRFVTLDSENRQVTVKCYKKGPSDGSFVQFGSDIVLAPGGNSGICNVDSSVMPTNRASYQFMASAQATGGPVVNSQVVGTNYSTLAPGTPTNYGKVQNGCNFTISFKGASDSGRTKKVEIYRSENTSFTADGGTKVGEVSLNSNETKTFENSADCGKKYYFVVRAFDEFGNGSGLTGDSEVSVTTTTNTTNGTTAGGGAIAVASGQANVGNRGGQVQGANEKTTPSPEASKEAVLAASSEAKADTNPKDDWKKYGVWIVIGLLIAAAGYVFITKRV